MQEIVINLKKQKNFFGEICYFRNGKNLQLLSAVELVCSFPVSDFHCDVTTAIPWEGQQNGRGERSKSKML